MAELMVHNREQEKIAKTIWGHISCTIYRGHLIHQFIVTDNLDKLFEGLTRGFNQ